MLRLSSDIRIADYTFLAVESVEVESSWDMFTDTCKITFPRKANWRGKPIAWNDDALVRRGDLVAVALGYDDENVKVFEGYVAGIDATIPVSINCQDEMWKLKQTTITKSWKEVDLKTLLSSILPSGVPFDAPDIRLGHFRISNASIVQVLDELKKRFFLKSWFRAGKLYCGFAYVPALQSTHVVRFNRNVVENSLEYIRKEDVSIRLKMISILTDNSKVEYEAGAEDGEQRTLYYYDKKLSDLKTIADSEIDRLRYEGYRGSVTVFGQPTFQHGDVVDLRDDVYPERDGRYLVKKVVYSYGLNGFRQVLELDSKI
jgi:hypothetical protein